MTALLIDQLLSTLNEVLLGKREQLELALSSVLASGHLLIEDYPGMGKTTLSQALAAVLGFSYQRVQFTSDLLPADIMGVSIFNQQKSAFEFHRGPLFCQLLLADEINRATPKTQSALLEAMEEGQVTLDGTTWPLPKPFFVIATQNPMDQMGTFPLPESQMDRFLMRISLGYPDTQVERELILGKDRRQLVAELPQLITTEQLLELQQTVKTVHLSAAIVDYVQRLVSYSRYQSGLNYGLSPRATLALVRSAQAYALVKNRDHVIPEDVQAVLEPVACHRLQPERDLNPQQGASLVQQMLETVDVLGSAGDR